MPTEMRVRGLDESVRAFSDLHQRVQKGFRLELVGFGKQIVSDGRARLAAREGGFAMRRQPGSFGSDVNSSGTKAVVFVERDGTSPAAEFGAKTHMVYGRRVSQRSMKRRTAAGWGRKGRIVGPEFTAIKARKRAARLADRGLQETTKQLNRYGVPRG